MYFEMTSRSDLLLTTSSKPNYLSLTAVVLMWAHSSPQLAQELASVTTNKGSELSMVWLTRLFWVQNSFQLRTYRHRTRMNSEIIWAEFKARMDLELVWFQNRCSLTTGIGSELNFDSELVPVQHLYEL